MAKNKKFLHAAIWTIAITIALVLLVAGGCEVIFNAWWH